MQEKWLETRLYITPTLQVHPGRPTDKPRQQETRLGTSKLTVLHMLKSQVRVPGILRPSCTLYLALTDTKLNISEQNTTVVSKATFIKTY